MKNKIEKFLEKGNICNQDNRKNAGITLVALVITIIVLLILAGITISQLSNSGLFDKSKQAKEEYQNAQDDENDKIAKYNNEIDSYVGGNRDTVTIPKEEYDIFKNANSFSTTEKVVGTWINGKPIYRKYLLPSSLKVDDNVEKIVNIKIYFTDINKTQQEVANPCYVNGDFYVMGFYLDQSKSIYINKSNNTTVDYLFVEYTKTTDTTQ